MPGTMLRLVFKGSMDKKITFSYPDANSTATDQVKNLMQVIVANNEIFAEQPHAIESATFITTISEPVNLNLY